MKKAIFFGLVALLALAVFSCDDDSLPKDEGGSGGITLGVKDSAGRALVGATAEGGTNFYEAAFENADGNIFRTTWTYARKGKIHLEPGTYTVIIMAGREADKTLLGVGAATDVKEKGVSVSTACDPDVLSVTITSDTTEIFFTVFPLVNDINDDGVDGTDTGNSSTDVDGISKSTFFTELNTTPTSKYPLQTIKDELGNEIPIFMINGGTTTAAEWSFSIREFNTTTDPGPGTITAPSTAGDLIDIFSPSIKIATTPAPELFTTGFSPIDSYDIPQVVTATFKSGADAGDDLAGTFVIEFDSKTPGDGLVLVALEVPVVAIDDSDSDDNPVIWYIRGGLYNGAIDAGISPTNSQAGKLGGAILLGMGTLDFSNFQEIHLNPKW